LYFYVWTFHAMALRTARHTQRVVAYPTALLVLWVVLAFHTMGYVVGSLQRLLWPERYVRPLAGYIAHAPS
jgi:hypothetical protein